MPVFLNIFGFAGKPEGDDSDTNSPTAMECEPEFICHGDVCRQVDRRSSVEATSVQQIRHSVKIKEKAQPEEKESLNEKSYGNTISEGLKTCTPSQTLICRILTLLRLKKFSPKCSLPSAQ